MDQQEKVEAALFLMDKNLRPMVMDRPLPDDADTGLWCPYCEGRDVVVLSTEHTCMGGDPDPNHYWQVCTCNPCEKSFTREYRHVGFLGRINVWYTEREENPLGGHMLLAGVPDFGRTGYIYTCSGEDCGGAVRIYHTEMDGKTVTTTLHTNLGGDGGTRRLYRTWAECDGCESEAELDVQKPQAPEKESGAAYGVLDHYFCSSPGEPLVFRWRDAGMGSVRVVKVCEPALFYWGTKAHDIKAAMGSNLARTIMLFHVSAARGSVPFREGMVIPFREHLLDGQNELRALVVMHKDVEDFMRTHTAADDKPPEITDEDIEGIEELLKKTNKRIKIAVSHEHLEALVCAYKSVDNTGVIKIGGSGGNGAGGLLIDEGTPSIPLGPSPPIQLRLGPVGEATPVNTVEEYKALADAMKPSAEGAVCEHRVSRDKSCAKCVDEIRERVRSLADVLPPVKFSGEPGSFQGHETVALHPDTEFSVELTEPVTTVDLSSDAEGGFEKPDAAPTCEHKAAFYLDCTYCVGLAARMVPIHPVWRHGANAVRGAITGALLLYSREILAKSQDDPMRDVVEDLLRAYGVAVGSGMSATPVRDGASDRVIERQQLTWDRVCESPSPAVAGTVDVTECAHTRPLSKTCMRCCAEGGTGAIITGIGSQSILMRGGAPVVPSQWTGAPANPNHASIAGMSVGTGAADPEDVKAVQEGPPPSGIGPEDFGGSDYPSQEQIDEETDRRARSRPGQHITDPARAFPVPYPTGEPAWANWKERDVAMQAAEGHACTTCDNPAVPECVWEGHQVRQGVMGAPSGMRCPHDGGACHSNCKKSCHREDGGHFLVVPWAGYPLPGRGVCYTGIAPKPSAEAIARAAKLLHDRPLPDSPPGDTKAATPDPAPDDNDAVRRTRLARDLEDAINRNSAENGSNTPDFILAELLGGCLGVFDEAVRLRDRWYGVKLRPVGEEPMGVTGEGSNPEPSSDLLAAHTRIQQIALLLGDTTVPGLIDHTLVVGRVQRMRDNHQRDLLFIGDALGLEVKGALPSTWVASILQTIRDTRRGFDDSIGGLQRRLEEAVSKERGGS